LLRIVIALPRFARAGDGHEAVNEFIDLLDDGSKFTGINVYHYLKVM
jgi:hypothetical protein